GAPPSLQTWFGIVNGVHGRQVFMVEPFRRRVWGYIGNGDAHPLVLFQRQRPRQPQDPVFVDRRQRLHHSPLILTRPIVTGRGETIPGISRNEQESERMKQHTPSQMAPAPPATPPSSSASLDIVTLEWSAELSDARQ